MKVNDTRDGLLAMIRDGKPMSLRQQLRLTAVLSFPAIVAQLSTIVMQYIDAAMVGSLGAESSASIGLMASSTWLFWGLCSAAATGFSVQVANRIGANDKKSAQAVLKHLISDTRTPTPSSPLVPTDSHLFFHYIKAALMPHILKC